MLYKFRQICDNITIVRPESSLWVEPRKMGHNTGMTLALRYLSGLSCTIIHPSSRWLNIPRLRFRGKGHPVLPIYS